AFEAKTHLSEYLRCVEQEGETILIQRYGKDVAVLQPCSNMEQEKRNRRTTEVLQEFSAIREEEATYGANAEIQDMIDEGRKH
ncbi:MAG: type II toxin-antitoxin system Phd/YefM family antitoxin, partial [Planctomycetota bacterium]